MWGKWNMTVDQAETLAAEIKQAYARSDTSYIKEVQVCRDDEGMAKLRVAVNLKSNTPVTLEFFELVSFKVVQGMIRNASVAFSAGFKSGRESALENIGKGLARMAEGDFNG